MNEKVLFVLLDEYADWEAASLAAALNEEPECDGRRFDVKTVSLTKDPVTSIGGFTVLPDYSIDDAPEEFAGLILIGGNSWRKDGSERVMELVDKVLSQQAVLGAICDASVFLGKNGLLNDVPHTSNHLEDLQETAGDRYTNEAHYLQQQAVRSSQLITANGSAFLEFGKEVLEALNAAPQPEIDEWYGFFKQGYYDYLKSQQ
ncbi:MULTISPECIES: type 1 glutamine amidotransferase family protein [unclassified Planococcus (in: firmicutes)]|uniref:type 1 glutamine amidotransferase family protein n=1 Tax=unclassified Planococcus (in: firmicutes) TaxID=2662419 RepID=UPI000C31B9E0|nr:MULTISPECIES: type 1 glutamine amidotransferase family protein [unclassified Planococcus (in: firmicutes)]AUD14989.1 glutamine amidotransferase [Planococcus sp. MB-3u-03]PKG47072.1 glutamine amidotransferase [Planococcus sp. Urea-trap-24]PKG87799.1 glutamine amidotransferase [Planococcus sp. Urea-3u-39]PKH35457.1 glutamine amidotransferase [Planococcus sp. MB-3u-09]